MRSEPHPVAYAVLRRRLPSPPERRAIRVGAGLSMRQLGAHLGVTEGAVSLWETGARFPSEAHLGPYVELLRELREVTDP